MKKSSFCRVCAGRLAKARPLILAVCSRCKKSQKGQGLVEYLLILALVAFGCIAGMHTIANAINSAFTAVGSVLGQYIK